MSENSNPKVWGPVLWKELHTITFKYPVKIDNNNPKDKEIREKVRRLFLDLRSTIPCKRCRDSYKIFIKQLPIDPYLGSREDLSYWLYKIHNKVNAKLRNYERLEYTKSIQQLEEHARLHRMSPASFMRAKNELRQQILITGPDPSFEYVKKMYTR